MGEVHHAVMDERCGLIAAVFHRHRPGEPQAPHRFGVDARQRAKALPIFSAAPLQPIRGGWFLQQCIGDR